MQNFRDVVLDSAGNRIANVTVTVTLASDGSAVTVYSDNGTTVLGTSGVFISTNGSVVFYAADGLYDVKYSATGFVDQTIDDVRLFDYSDASDLLLINRTASGATCLKLQVTNDGHGPRLSFQHVTTSPAANDVVGTIGFASYDDAGNVHEYAKFFALLADPANGSEDGNFRFQLSKAGTLTTIFDINSTDITSVVPYYAPACSASIPSMRLPHGTAPSAPTNGDIWTTTAGLFARINGVTIGPYTA